MPVVDILHLYYCSYLAFKWLNQCLPAPSSWSKVGREKWDPLRPQIKNKETYKIGYKEVALLFVGIIPPNNIQGRNNQSIQSEGWPWKLLLLQLLLISFFFN